MLLILPIILSRISQNIYLLFLHMPPIILKLFSVVMLQIIYTQNQDSR